MEADPQNNIDRMQHLSEEPATGAPKASLLRALAEEALAKGNPVLVIPLETSTESAGDSDEGSAHEEPHHEMRLPKNTTVIFTSESGFPVRAAPGGAKVAETSGDLGEAAARWASSPYTHDRASGLRIVDPAETGLAWSSLSSTAGKDDSSTDRADTTGSSTTGSSTSDSGSAANAAARSYSKGTRKAEKRHLSYEDVKHLHRFSAQPQSEDAERQ